MGEPRRRIRLRAPEANTSWRRADKRPAIALIDVELLEGEARALILCLAGLCALFMLLWFLT